MVILFSGTPGSGKSLHAAEMIYNRLRYRGGRPVICNFELNLSLVKKNRHQFHFIDNSRMDPLFLETYARRYWRYRGQRPKEGHILLLIDEAQMIFNARSWQMAGRTDWMRFFQIHRHLGFDIVLLAQFDRMLDRQIRYLIEYEYIHRKVVNYGLRGVIVSLLMLSPRLHACVKVWYPLRQKVGGNFFRVKKLYYQLYDSYGDFR